MLIGVSNSYAQLIGLGLFLGIAGSTFPVGVGFTSKWFTPDQQGTALGVYGMGNIGQSVAVFGAPVLAIALGSWRPVFFVFAAMSLIWAVVFYLFARDAPSTAKPKTMAENLAVLRREPTRLGPVALLLPNIRWVCRFCDLSSQSADGHFQTECC